eukprot:COSAG02_NODE_32357_length_517_cov_1.598086_1_plen_49_part_01
MIILYLSPSMSRRAGGSSRAAAAAASPRLGAWASTQDERGAAQGREQAA